MHYLGTLELQSVGTFLCHIIADFNINTFFVTIVKNHTACPFFISLATVFTIVHAAIFFATNVVFLSKALVGMAELPIYAGVNIYGAGVNV
jgi:hypothetical protein